jgi:predicted thioesterase
MERLVCTATVETPEIASAHVSEPQVVVFWTGPADATVIAYFMENAAYEITDPHAVPVGPEISLRYAAHSPSGAAVAGVSLRKLVYRFRGLTQRKYVFSLRAVSVGPTRPGTPAR